MLSQVTVDDIHPIAIGAGILGTGGGGNPYLGSLHLRSGAGGIRAATRPESPDIAR